MPLPPNHPLRMVLNDEVNARPPEPMQVPSRLSYLVLLCDEAERDLTCQAVGALCRRYGAFPPADDAWDYAAELGSFRLQWERHNEFIRFTFVVDGECDQPFTQTALSLLPRDWLKTLPGQVLVAANAALIPGEPGSVDTAAIARKWFAGNMPIGSAVSEGAMLVMTDFQIDPEGFSRHVVVNHHATSWQAGRILHRLIDIDTYRALALLAFPVARTNGPLQAASEGELAEITAALVIANAEGEPKLLDRLTRLEAELESRVAGTLSRFDAARAYYDLVQRRIAELREERIEGLQTFGGFIERRLTPAMSTCRSLVDRQASLSLRLSRANRLLSTRVDLTREQQNQTLLESMERRARMQLRLQATVEGLSVAAVTYYCCGLVGHAAEALLVAGVQLRPELATGMSIPVVWLVALVGLRHFRKAGRLEEV